MFTQVKAEKKMEILNLVSYLDFCLKFTHKM